MLQRKSKRGQQGERKKISDEKTRIRVSNRRNYYKCSTAELSMLKKNTEDTDGGREKEQNCS